MLSILFVFICLFSFGIYIMLVDYLKLPSYKASKVVLSINKREKKKVKNFDVFILELSTKISKYIKINDYKKRKLIASLKSAEINLSPETYIARAYIKAGMVLLSIIPALIILPMISPVILFLTVAIYFKEVKSADEAVKKQREEIEYELPRFASTLTQELKASRDVLSILETYKQNAGKSMKSELEITIADMKSGSYEAALTRFETRLGSSTLSEVIRGLISVLRGDDGVVYFQMLSHDLKQLELQRLKGIAAKQPSKIRKYSFAMLICFVFMYLGVMGVEIVKTLGNMF
ncbi:secretion protein F [Clostridium sp. DJ247]|uniref:secretion protein F n=1 Tax=Clostridium sp. DJ247 TaxID=2726188 RepID=UPI001623F30E|nr:secretion protein F [Clostridium sp. DJ247]MBC2579390.1 secretion protein F [Clostridium sp. DJ247]